MNITRASLTFDDGKNDVVVDELLPELADFSIFLKDLRLLSALLLRQVLHSNRFFEIPLIQISIINFSETFHILTYT